MNKEKNIQWKLFATRPGISLLFLSVFFPSYTFSYISKRRVLKIGQDYKKFRSNGEVYFDKRDFNRSRRTGRG